jgi:hypothetical protein
MRNSRTHRCGHDKIAIIISRWFIRVLWRIRQAGLILKVEKGVFGQTSLSPTVKRLKRVQSGEAHVFGVRWKGRRFLPPFPQIPRLMRESGR